MTSSHDLPAPDAYADDLDEAPPVLGAVLDAGRGHLPYTLLHGEALVTCAAWALGEAGAHAIDLDTGWAGVVETGLDLVLHDSLCPMTPADFIAACVAASRAEGVVVVGVRPVTDTVKRVADGLVGESVDRDGLLAVASPVVLPAEVVAALDAPPTGSLADLVAGLRGRDVAVRPLEAPAEARRVASPEDVRILEALTTPHR